MHERGEASIQDIDTAMQLGAGHPMGPLHLVGRKNEEEEEEEEEEEVHPHTQLASQQNRVSVHSPTTHPPTHPPRRTTSVSTPASTSWKGG